MLGGRPKYIDYLLTDQKYVRLNVKKSYFKVFDSRYRRLKAVGLHPKFFFSLFWEFLYKFKLYDVNENGSSYTEILNYKKFRKISYVRHGKKSEKNAHLNKNYFYKISSSGWTDILCAGEPLHFRNCEIICDENLFGLKQPVICIANLTDNNKKALSYIVLTLKDIFEIMNILKSFYKFETFFNIVSLGDRFPNNELKTR